MTAARMVLGAARIPDRAELVDIVIEHGKVARVVPAGAALGDVTDVAGRVVVPAFVEPHLHLDKALLGASAGEGGLAAAIAETTRRKAAFTRDDLLGRAERVLRMALRAGTTAIRAQTEVDPGIGLRGAEAMAELADRHREWLGLQVAVFPQEGLLCRPGTETLMRDALRTPGAVVGGCPYVESSTADARRHVDLVLEMAQEHGSPADFHLDLADDTQDGRFALAEYVARATIERGLQGRVTIGHVTSLAALPYDDLRRTSDSLREADIAVVVLPATDLHLTGRADHHNPRRGVAPYRVLAEAGVRVAVSSNNVRNAFTPTGTADPLDMALLLGRLFYATTDADFAALLEMATTAGRRILHPSEVAPLTAGSEADLVVLSTRDPVSPVVSQPERWAVIRGGRVVYRRATTEQFPAALTPVPQEVR